MFNALYRGKRTNKDEWVEGGICQTEDWTIIFYINDFPGNDFEPLSCELDEAEVIPETVGQFTGHTDTTEEKTRIFALDIVQDKDGINWLVRCDVDLCTFTIDCITTTGIHDYVLFNKETIKKMQLKVVGNVVDNKELLHRADKLIEECL